MEFYQTFLVLTLVTALFLGTLAFIYHSGYHLLDRAYQYALHPRGYAHPADPHFSPNGAWDL